MSKRAYSGMHEAHSQELGEPEHNILLEVISLVRNFPAILCFPVKCEIRFDGTFRLEVKVPYVEEQAASHCSHNRRLGCYLGSVCLRRGPFAPRREWTDLVPVLEVA